MTELDQMIGDKTTAADIVAGHAEGVDVERASVEEEDRRARLSARFGGLRRERRCENDDHIRLIGQQKPHRVIERIARAGR